jgi:uncharacterized membrane protein
MCDIVCLVKRFLIILGVVLFVLGILALAHPSFEYQKHEEVAKIGPITATVEKHETTQIPVAATASLLIVGLILVVLGTRAKS